MPLQNRLQALSPGHLPVDGHPHLYRDYSDKAASSVSSRAFSPRVEMASIDEAYLDITGTERLHGPPTGRPPTSFTKPSSARRRLNCSIGIATSRMVAKICSDQAKPNGVLWIQPGLEAAFLAPLDVRKIPGVGKVTEQQLLRLGVRKIGDLARLDERFLERQFGKWGLALSGKAQGRDAGGWFDSEIGADEDAKSISHEHTFHEDTADVEQVDATLARMTEMVARRLREHGFFARTVQIKIRYSDFATYTRARTLDHATQLDNEILTAVRDLLRKNWSRKPLRLLGVQASGLETSEGQLHLLDHEKSERWRKVLEAADQLRDRFGESSVSLASSLRGRFRERSHEAMPQDPRKKEK
jgi:DNA polymerase IV